MGKIDEFSILFQKQDPIYCPGEAVVGNLNLRIEERLKINSVKIIISGYGRVHWTESQVSGNSITTLNYSSDEEYMNIPVVFIQKQPDSDLYLEVDDYSYPFHIVLPPNLPTSFEQKFGRVRYTVKGIIEIPRSFDKHSIKSFSVINHYDLNLNQALRQPYGVSGSKVVCCGVCKSDQITAQFSIMKGGYVPGECIVFNVKIDNKSNRAIERMNVSLLQKIRFHAVTKSRTVNRKVASINYPGIVGANSFEEWNNSVLSIPSVCSSSNGACRIIDINYIAVFNFGVSGPPNSTDLNIPVVIGTLPLRQHFQQGTSMAGVGLDPSAPPPYSYEACMFGPNPVQEEIGKGEIVESDFDSYKPFYPFYKDYSLDTQTKY